jgi:hypothetical protein
MTKLQSIRGSNSPEQRRRLGDLPEAPDVGFNVEEEVRLVSEPYKAKCMMQELADI